MGFIFDEGVGAYVILAAAIAANFDSLTLNYMKPPSPPRELEDLDTPGVEN